MKKSDCKKRKTLTRHYIEIFFVSLVAILVLSILLISENWKKYKTDTIDSEAMVLAGSTAAYYSYLISMILRDDILSLKKYYEQIKIEEKINSVEFFRSDEKVNEFLKKCQAYPSEKKVAGYIPSCHFAEKNNVFVIQEITSGSRVLGYLVKSRQMPLGSFLQYGLGEPSLLLCVFFVLIFGGYYLRELHLNVVGPLSLLSKKAKTLNLDDVKDYKLHEIHYLAHALADSQHELIKSSKLAAMGETARQVSHDIRSPLAALIAISSCIPEVDEERRVLIRSAVQRINDIANDLSGRKSGGVATNENSENENSSVQLLSGLVESLISEKRTQFRSRLGIKIESDLGKDSYGLFAKIQPVEFKRVLSNLVNNAVEAMGNAGQVVVKLKNLDCRGSSGASEPCNDRIQITVSDNGKGIPVEILPELMQRGATFGKENAKHGGSGLGLYHAMESLKLWLGDIRLESEVGVGTKVIITLPKQTAPSWFVSEIKITDQTQIVILDDDSSIHHVWDGRLFATKVRKENIFHFTTAEDVVMWNKKNDKNSTVFLFDYELLGDKKTGLDVIEELSVSKNSILVTSRFEEENIRERCDKLGVKLLPKNLAGFVPIIFKKTADQNADF